MNQIQSIQDLKLKQEEFFILSNKNYRSCPRHPDNWIVSLSTNPNSSQFIQCAECFSENPNQYYLNLVGLIKENEKTVFKNYPVYGDNELYEKLKQIFEADCSVDGLLSKISSFFLNLRKQIDQKIILKEEQMMSQAKSLWSLNEQVIIQYNKLAEKEQLKNIITNFKDDLDKQNELFKELFTRISTNQKKYQEELNEKIDFFETQKSMINFETAESINQNIVQLIDSIDMFVIKNFEDLKIDNSKEKLELYEKDIQTKDKNEMTTSQLMAKLISNRSNCCSQELTKELQKIVFKLSNSIDRVDIKNLLNEDLLELEFDKMNDEQFDLIKDLSRYFITGKQELDERSDNKDKLIKLISNKFNFCSEQFLSNLSAQFDSFLPIINKINFKDYLQPNKTPINADFLNNLQLLEIADLVQRLETSNNNQNQNDMDQNLQNQQIKIKQQKLISLLENKTNYCHDYFIQNAKNSIQKYSQIINHLFLNVEIFKENKSQTIDFSKLTTKQIDNLEQLANKISQLTQQFGQAYYNSTSPIFVQQIKSNYFSKQLGNNKDIEQLLVNYPIFETINLPQFNIEFIKSNYESSQQLILEKNKLLGYIVKQPKSLTGQIFTRDKLDPNLNYIFRCKVNQNLNCNYLCFGIMNMQEIHNKFLFGEKCCFRTSDSGYGLDKILKGKNLYEVRQEINELEIRVNISKRVVLFMDYPKYQNINKVDESKIIQDKNYSFGIYFSTPGDDYNIEIKTLLIDDKYLENFDQK
ncbi:von willebrand factor type A domain protein (macronuclear) [Tetrahymena thermophila SB210]|uniref:von willebrand factor type A domain protein n=1 Tax=Tetrahymena thermophila (strain SB210) TaxID=312017 RepID=Q22ZF7_TETTS|nr:von willebrand factor type A domain protein [Tetrahymena thermophila SB210]EAR90661.1 von willebrand factor type A domain protein [Tetrahymena thermophila SB210]|eukprot:XP_001010906.1 von willebrand factor type A domain protein [Tetrahymena thermophila SB210]